MMEEIIEIDDDAKTPQVDWNSIYIPRCMDHTAYQDFVRMLQEKLPWEQMGLPDPNVNPNRCVNELAMRQSVSPLHREAGNAFDPVLIDGVAPHPFYGPNRHHFVERVTVDQNFVEASYPDVMVFEINCEPIAWRRPIAHVRRGASGNPGRFYNKNVANPNKESTKRFVSLVEDFARNEWDKPLVRVYGDLPVVVDLIFARRLPNKYFISDDRSRPLKAAVVTAFQQNRIADPSTPDVDNLSKFVLDALQGLLYDNDNQVVKCIATKVLDTKPPHNGRICFTVRPAKRNDLM